MRARMTSGRMTSVRNRWRRWYGESPLQLLLLACSFALVAYAGVQLLAGDWWGVLVWMVGAALLHDLVLLPLYAAADRVVRAVLGAVGRREWLMFVRVPAALSGLLLLVWFPLISGRVERRYEASTGSSGDGFLARWLLMTGALFGVSALWMLIRSVRARRRATKQRPSAVH